MANAHVDLQVAAQKYVYPEMYFLKMWQSESAVGKRNIDEEAEEPWKSMSWI